MPFTEKLGKAGESEIWDIVANKNSAALKAKVRPTEGAKPRVDHLNRFLLEAAHAGWRRGVSYCLSLGADPNVLLPSGWCPVIAACSYRAGAQVLEKILRAGGNPNASWERKDTALHEAASHGWVRQSRQLIEFGANVDAQNVHGDTPLMLAASFGYLRLVKCLVSSGANRDLRNGLGLTAKDIAEGCLEKEPRYSRIVAVFSGA